MARTTLFRVLFTSSLVYFGSTSAFAQTAAEQLQKGIFAQESQGKLDDAIAIYRQIASSTATPRDTAAQAQYRLAQALLQKGDIPNATREFERLERTFPEAGPLISQLSTRLHAPLPGAANNSISDPMMEQISQVRRAMEAGTITGTPIKIYGKISQVQWVNPSSVLQVSTSTTPFIFVLASPNQMSLQGMKRETLKVGDMVTVTGILPDISQANGIGVANTIETASDGQLVFDRAKVTTTSQVIAGGGRGGNGPGPGFPVGTLYNPNTGTFYSPNKGPLSRLEMQNAMVTTEGVVPTFTTPPDYSDEARKAKFQGEVQVALTVDEKGNPTNLRVVKRLGLGLDEKALEAIAKWKFAPANHPTDGLVTLNFRLL